MRLRAAARPLPAPLRPCDADKAVCFLSAGAGMDCDGGGGLTDGGNMLTNANTLEGENEVCTARRAGRCALLSKRKKT